MFYNYKISSPNDLANAFDRRDSTYYLSKLSIKIDLENWIPCCNPYCNPSVNFAEDEQANKGVPSSAERISPSDSNFPDPSPSFAHFCTLIPILALIPSIKRQFQQFIKAYIESIKSQKPTGPQNRLLKVWNLPSIDGYKELEFLSSQIGLNIVSWPFLNRIFLRESKYNCWCHVLLSLEKFSRRKSLLHQKHLDFISVTVFIGSQFFMHCRHFFHKLITAEPNPHLWNSRFTPAVSNLGDVIL